MVTTAGVKWGVVYFGKLVFGEWEFSLKGVNKSKKIISHPGGGLLKSVLKVRNAWVKVEWVETEEELSVICIAEIRVLRGTVFKMKVEGREQNLEEHHKRKYAMKRGCC